MKICSSCGMIFGSINPSFQILALHQADQPHQFVPELSKTGHQDKQQAARENIGGKDQLQEGIASNETEEMAIFKNGPSNLELTSSTEIMKNTIIDLDDWNDVPSNGNSLHSQITVDPRGVAWHPDLRFHQIWFWQHTKQ